MKIVVTTSHQYPVGTALTNRIRSYLEELAALGHSVLVLIYRASEDSRNVQNQASGELNGVRYRSTAHSVKKSKNPIIARFVRLYSYSNCVRILFQEERREHIDIILQASARSTIIPILWVVCRIIRAKYVLENNEYPWFYLKRRTSNIWEKPLYEKVYYRLFDGILAMTIALQEYHSKYSKKTAKVFHLPMTVDMNRFNLGIERENLITYIGNVSYHKDGVGILVDSFISIAQQHPDWKLMIIGDTSKDNDIIRKVREHGLENRVILKGAVHRDDVPELLCKSKILALARPNGLQSEGGFPTKLGEYLATGNLVVVTKVGDISRYLRDKESAIIAEPNSVVSFSACLDHAIVNYEKLTDVRLAGYWVCKRVFNSNLQVRHLEEYLTRLLDEIKTDSRSK